jgi:hypothetical protein
MATIHQGAAETLRDRRHASRADHHDDQSDSEVQHT